MRKAVFAAAIVASLNIFIFSDGLVSAATDSQLRLYIQPEVCPVDVVQDGGGQTIHVPDHCRPIIPGVLTPILEDERAPFFSLPFAGEDTPEEIVAQPGSGGSDSVWTPIASTGQSTQPLQQNAWKPTVMAAGIGAAVTATAVALDVALFEMHYSKTVMRWTRKLPLHKLLRQR